MARKAEKIKSTISALISVDEFSAQKFLENLKEKGYKLVEVDLTTLSPQEFRWKALQGSLFNLRRIFLVNGLLDKGVIRKGKELVVVFEELRRAKVNVLLRLVANRWPLRPEILGKEIYEYVQSDKVNRIVLETPRKRKSELEKTLRLAETLNLPITYELATEIVERFSGNMELIDSFLKKIASSGISDEGLIRDMLRSENPDFEMDNLAFLDAFSSKEWDRVLRMVRNLRLKGQDITPLYYLISAQFTLALEVLSGLRKGRKVKEIAGELKTHYYRIVKLSESLDVNGSDPQKWSEEELTDLVVMLMWGEINAKRGRKTYSDTLEEVALWFLERSRSFTS